MSVKIPVTVITGAPGSGKSTLLQHLLDENPDAAQQAVVLTSADSAPGIRHARSVQLPGPLQAGGSGCLCCTVQGALVETLRGLFLDALHRKIPAFSHVFIETSGLEDPAAVVYTLQYERFLAERYCYRSTLCLVDTPQVPQAMLENDEAVQQILMADVLVMMKAEHESARALDETNAILSSLNPQSAIYYWAVLPARDVLLARSDFLRPFRRESTSLWNSRHLGVPRRSNALASLRLGWQGSMRRSAYFKLVSLLEGEGGSNVLRARGIVLFEGDAGPSQVHAVHRHFYPPRLLPKGEAAPDLAVSAHTSSLSGSSLHLIFRGPVSRALQDSLLACLPAGASCVSPEGN